MASNILGGLIGIPLALGTQVPGLVRGARESKNLKTIQAQGGAGALAARRSADIGARAAAGLAGGGNSSSRGMNLLTGLRAGEDAREAGAAQAGQMAAHEGLAATEMLRANDIARRQGIGTIGAASAGTVAQISAQQLAAEDQTATQQATEAQRAHEMALAQVMSGGAADPVAAQGAALAQAQASPDHQAQMDATLAAMSPEEQAQFTGMGGTEGGAPPPAPGTGYGSEDGPQSNDRPSSDRQLLQNGLQQLDQAKGKNMLPNLDPAVEDYNKAQTMYDTALRDPKVAMAIASGLQPDKALELHFPGLTLKRAQAISVLRQGGLA